MKRFISLLLAGIITASTILPCVTVKADTQLSSRVELDSVILRKDTDLSITLQDFLEPHSVNDNYLNGLSGRQIIGRVLDADVSQTFGELVYTECLALNNSCHFNLVTIEASSTGLDSLRDIWRREYAYTIDSFSCGNSNYKFQEQPWVELKILNTLIETNNYNITILTGSGDDWQVTTLSQVFSTLASSDSTFIDNFYKNGVLNISKDTLISNRSLILNIGKALYTCNGGDNSVDIEEAIIADENFKVTDNANINTLMREAVNAERALTEEDSNAASSEAETKVGNNTSTSQSYTIWGNAIVALYNDEDVNDKEGFSDPDKLKAAPIQDEYYKTALFALTRSWPKEDNALTAYNSLDVSNIPLYTNGDAPIPDSDAVTSACNSVADTSLMNTENLYDYMNTSYARAVYWSAMATVTDESLRSTLYNSYDKFMQYVTNGKSMFYLSSTTADLQTGLKLPIVDFDAFTHYIEISQEMDAYINRSKPAIEAAISQGTDIEMWHGALKQLKACCDYMQMLSMTNAYDTNFQPLFAQLDAIVGQSGSIGDLSGSSDALQAGDPLSMFFANLSNQKLSDNMITGIAYSAAFVPMRTNMYDPYTVKDWSDDFLYDFHYRYGYYRKALYIADSSDAAQSLANTDLVGTTSVCTLKDLINPAGDIVLYIDDNFYNVDDLAELLDKSYNRITNDSEGDRKTDADGDGEADSVVEKWWTSLTENVSEMLDMDVSSQVKTGDNTQYSRKLRNRVSSQKNSDYLPDAYILDESNSFREDVKDNDDHVVLTSGQINEYLSMTANEQTDNGNAKEVYDDYNVLQPYSIVSAVYRSSKLFNIANDSKIREPVFIASRSVPNSNSASQAERNEIFNWLLLKNIKSQMPIGYSTSLDMEAPVYMDIYGNILTESGTVVVPAASNATLFSDNYYRYGNNMGLLYVYGRDYTMKEDDVQGVLVSTLSEMMEVDDYLNTWKMRSDVYSYEGEIGTLMDTARISIADDNVKQLMQNTFYEYLYTDSHVATTDIANATSGYDFYKYAGIVLEVMRGAPIECIDKDFENLNTARTMTNAGLSAAAKLEVLDAALDENGVNSLLAIPNLAFVDGFEYIALFTFKVLMLVVTLVLMFTLYRDMVGQSLSLQTLFKCISLVVITCLAIVTVPEAFDISYYQANKLFLQNETEYIAMLNEEKRQNGVEIGVTSIEEPDTSTKLLLKLTDLDVPWYDLFQKVMLSNTYKGLSEVYESFAENSPISQQEDVEVMNDGVYVYVNDLFDSATIDIDEKTGQLDLRTDEVTTAAFYTPYYVILEALVTDINTYNELYDWKGYTTTLQSGGRLKSVGACQGYFSDKSFMQSSGDILHLHEVYGIADELNTYRVWTDEDVALMQKCAWACGSPNDYNRLYKVSDRARDFVANNQNLLGKISDETFLKVMALDIAMYHNSIFGVASCNAIEIEQLSQDDLCRLMIGTKEEAMYNSSLSYGRYVYQIGGAFAVYLAAAFSLIMFALGFLKPILSLAIFISIFVSLFVFKVVLRKSTSSIHGYVVTTLLLCMCNFGHAAALKMCMYFPDLGLSPAVCVILCAFVQFVYIACLSGVAYVALRDWRDLGWARYQYKASQMEVGANELLARFKYKMHIKGSNKESMRMRDVMTSNNGGGTKMYDNLTERRERRKKRYGIG